MAVGTSAGSVFVRLGAIFDDDGFDKFERRHVSASRAKDIKARLGGDFDERGFREYEQHLSKVEAKVKRRDAFKATLGGDYNAQAFRAYERDLAKAERETAQSSQRMRKAFAYGFGFLSASGVYSAIRGVKSVTSAFGESETSGKKLQAQLKALGIDYDKHADRIDKVIQKTSKLAGLDDEDLQDAFTAIVRTTGSVNTALKDMALVADLARAKGMDVAKAGELIAKVHAGNVGPLKRLGLEFVKSTENLDKLKASTKNATADQIDAAKAADKQANSVAALDLLQKKLSGQAVEYGKSQTGAVQRAQVAWENLREKIGEKLAPAFTQAANDTADFVNEMEDGTGEGGRFVKKLEDIWEWLKRLYERVRGGVGWLSEHKDLVKGAAGAWLAYKAAVMAAGAASKLNAPFLLAGSAAGGAGAGAGGAGRGSRSGRAIGVATGVGTAVAGGSPTTGAIGGAVAGGAIAGPWGIAAGAAIGGVYGGVVQRANEMKNDTARYEELRRQIGYTAEESARLKEVLIQTGNVNPLKGINSEKLASLRDGIGGLKIETKKAGQSMQVLGDAISQELGKRLSRELRYATQQWDGFGDRTKVTVHDVRKFLGFQMRSIRNDMDTNSLEGRIALAKNFKLARDAIKDAMDKGQISTKDGLAEIKRLMMKELKLFGLSPQQIKDYQRDSGHGSGNEAAGGGHAGGGWIGSRGQAGGDTVPARLGLGEAVLNRHQQEPVEYALQAVYGMNLDDLFASIQRPHYLAKGGIVSVPGFPGERANASILPMIAAVSKKFGLTLTDAYGQGHKSPGHTQTGTAADFAGSDKAMDAAVRWLVGKGYLVGYDGRFGSQSWPGHGPSYVAGGNAHLHVEFTSAGGGGGGGAATEIRAPRSGLKGMIGQLVQATLNTGAAAANGVLGDALSVPVAGGGGGGADERQIRGWLRAGLRLAGQKPSAANVNTLLGRVMQESGGNPRAVNNWDSNAKKGIPSKGLLQTIGPTFEKYKVKGHGDIFNPVDNTAAAVRYMIDRYGHLVGPSATGYASGGKVTKKAKPKVVPRAVLTGSASPAQLSPRALKGVEKLQGPRIRTYESWIAKAEKADSEFDYLERSFNMSEEEFIREDGSLDQDAINQRASELGGLRTKLVDRLNALRQARAIAKRITDTYGTLVARFTTARSALNGKKAAKRKEEYGKKISQYQSDLSTWKGTLDDFDSYGGQYSLDSAKLDIADLDKEVAGVLGTKAQPADLGQDDSTGSSSDTATAAATAPTPEEIAAAAYQQVQAATQARQDLLNNFASNFTTAFAASRPGGVLSGAASEMAAAGGLRYLGAGGPEDSVGATAGSQGAQVTQYIEFTGPQPADPHTLAQTLAYELGAAL